MDSADEYVHAGEYLLQIRWAVCGEVCNTNIYALRAQLLNLGLGDRSGTNYPRDALSGGRQYMTAPCNGTTYKCTGFLKRIDNNLTSISCDTQDENQ